MSSLDQKQTAPRTPDPARCEWGDYKAPRARSKFCERTDFIVRFADRRVIRVSYPSDSRKPFNFGPASRVAQWFWVSKVAETKMPDRTRLSGEARIVRKRQIEASLTPPAITEITVVYR